MQLTNPGQKGAKHVKVQSRESISIAASCHLWILNIWQVRTCDDWTACKGDAQSQGEALKPKQYAQCGALDARISAKADQIIHFNENATYIVFSNGPRRVGVLDPVAVFEFWKPKTGVVHLVPGQ